MYILAKITTSALLLLTLAGCRNLAQVGGDQGGQKIGTTPTIYVQPASIDQDKIKGDIVSTLDDHIKLETKNVQQQMSGALNVAEAKIADKLTGLETNFDGKVTGLETKIQATATVASNNKTDLEAKLADTMKIVTELKVQLTNQMEMTNTLKSKIELQADVITELKLKIGEVQGAANAQVGWNNQFDQRIEKMNAGRDVNYLPKEAVYIVLGILSVVTLGITILGQLAKTREQNRTAEERQERQEIFQLLLEVVSDKDPTLKAKLREMQERRGLSRTG